MTQMLIRPGVWLLPEPAPLKGTLLDAATMNGDIAFTDTTGIYESYNCITTDTLAAWPCPTTVLVAPTQTAASTATTGGTLAAGTYRAVITGVNARGETVASNEISQTTTGAVSTITWNWTALTGATGYRIYVTAVGGGTGTETFLIQVGAVTTYVWTGTPAASAGAPPTINTATVSTTKNFNQSPSFVDGFRFAVYTGVICKAVGFDIPDAESQLERVFSNKESVAVARAILQNRFVASATHWAAPTDITPAGGAVDPSVGLALLEGHAGNYYGGYPLVHAGRTIGSLLTRNGQASLDGNLLRSALGTPIAADSGYEYPNSSPTGTAPAAGEQWIYASGQVTLASGPAFQTWDLDRFESGDSNRVKILRERAYVASVDCYAAAIKVKVQ